MKKVIIIAYYYPPSNFVGGDRVAAWTEHLADFDIYPIIITRNWNEGQTDLTDRIEQNEYRVEKTDRFEIHRLPFKRSLRDQCADISVLKPLQKLLTLKELILSNYRINALPYANFYKKAEELCEREDISAVIASGRPFQSFAIGHALKKKFNLLWIPDYRDEWTTHEHLDNSSFLKRWINKLERKSEVRWTSNADFFTCTAASCCAHITALINRSGKVVLNGYDELRTLPRNTNETLTITYAGTLYPSQDFEPFINACEAFLNQGNRLKVNFIGVNLMPGQKEKIEALTKNREAYHFIPRVPKKELEMHLSASDLLLLTNYAGIDGWYPVKLFYYYSLGIPMLLCPTDNGTMENFIVKCNAGFVAKDETDCLTILNELRAKKQNGQPIVTERNVAYGEQYSRYSQSKLLADFVQEALN